MSRSQRERWHDWRKRWSKIDNWTSKLKDLVGGLTIPRVASWHRNRCDTERRSDIRVHERHRPGDKCRNVTALVTRALQGQTNEVADTVCMHAHTQSCYTRGIQPRRTAARVCRWPQKLERPPLKGAITRACCWRLTAEDNKRNESRTRPARDSHWRPTIVPDNPLLRRKSRLSQESR